MERYKAIAKDIFNELGEGYDECIYHKAFEVGLRPSGFWLFALVPRDVSYGAGGPRNSGADAGLLHRIFLYNNSRGQKHDKMSSLKREKIRKQALDFRP